MSWSHTSPFCAIAYITYMLSIKCLKSISHISCSEVLFTNINHSSVKTIKTLNVCIK